MIVLSLCNYSLVIVNDRVKSVCHCKHCAVCEGLPDGGLDHRVCLKVNSSRGLVQHQDTRLTEQTTGQAHELALTNAGERYIDR